MSNARSADILVIKQVYARASAKQAREAEKGVLRRKRQEARERNRKIREQRDMMNAALSDIGGEAGIMDLLKTAAKNPPYDGLVKVYLDGRAYEWITAYDKNKKQGHPLAGLFTELKKNGFDAWYHNGWTWVANGRFCDGMPEGEMKKTSLPYIAIKFSRE